MSTARSTWVRPSHAVTASDAPPSSGDMIGCCMEESSVPAGRCIPSLPADLASPATIDGEADDGSPSTGRTSSLQCETHGTSWTSSRTCTSQARPVPSGNPSPTETDFSAQRCAKYRSDVLPRTGPASGTVSTLPDGRPGNRQAQCQDPAACHETYLSPIRRRTKIQHRETTQ